MSLIVNTEYEEPVVIQKNGHKPRFKIAKGRNWLMEKIEVPMAIKLMNNGKPQRILQVGCGQGTALTPLYYRCQPERLVGIDTDERLLRRGDRRLKIREVSADLYQEDVRYMSFPDESFDVVLDFGLFYGISQREKALKEVARILAPGGIFVFKTKISHFFSKPVQSLARSIPWKALPELRPDGWSFLWAARRKSE